MEKSLMRIVKQVVTLITFFCCLPLAQANQSPVGLWTTIDENGDKRAVVELKLSGETLNGTIIKVFPKPTDTGICSKCPEPFKDKKILGLEIVNGLKDQGNGVWDGGSILDPKTGKVYKVKMTAQGDKLTVRGYIGISALGRTQVWFK